jgi:hypothetical protein
MNERQLQAIHFRMAVWFTLWVLAGLCGLPLFDHATIFWVTVLTAISINKKE